MPRRARQSEGESSADSECLIVGWASVSEPEGAVGIEPGRKDVCDEAWLNRAVDVGVELAVQDRRPGGADELGIENEDALVGLVAGVDELGDCCELAWVRGVDKADIIKRGSPRRDPVGAPSHRCFPIRPMGQVQDRRVRSRPRAESASWSGASAAHRRRGALNSSLLTPTTSSWPRAGSAARIGDGGWYDTLCMSDVVGIYEAGDEDVRMVTASNRVEWERTLELLRRWLPAAPARVLDIGGGPGRYACWLRDNGYDVTLLDPVPKHVRQAQARDVDAVLGDARELPFEDASADAVLMLGPLYHLPTASDRALALAEAVRCAVPGLR
jgi:hypothetical protein